MGGVFFLCGRYLQAERFFDGVAVETDDGLTVDVYDGHAHLARLLDHLLRRLIVRADVDLLVLDAVGLEVVLGHFAVGAGGCGVDGDGVGHK